MTKEDEIIYTLTNKTEEGKLLWREYVRNKETTHYTVTVGQHKIEVFKADSVVVLSNEGDEIEAEFNRQFNQEDRDKLVASIAKSVEDKALQIDVFLEHLNSL